jgi:isopentenyl-diphosphate delta-isomerase
MASLVRSLLESSPRAMAEHADADDRDRKLEHIELALGSRSQLDLRHFDRFRFEHEALPELDMAEIDISCELFGKQLRAPLLVSCMTGGTGSATRINRNLAIAAERAGVALGVGSQRKAIERPETTTSFRVRDLAPTVPLLGNLGAVQLNYGFGLEECRQAIAMIGADALALHLNPLQEAIQPEGQTNFKGLYEKIGHLVAELEQPVVIKEIGCGITLRTGRELWQRGVRHFDSAGVGGTSWARIEGARGRGAAGKARGEALGDLFADWGVPTPDSIRQLASLEGVTVIGSGGIRSGLDAAKAIALGAKVAGLAQPFLAAALESADQVFEVIEKTIQELRITMFCVGAANLAELRKKPLLERA